MLGVQLCGILDLVVTLDQAYELVEIEDSDKEEKDEKEEEYKLLSFNHSSTYMQNNAITENYSKFRISLIHIIGIDTPPPEFS